MSKMFFEYVCIIGRGVYFSIIITKCNSLSLSRSLTLTPSHTELRVSLFMLLGFRLCRDLRSLRLIIFGD